MYIILLLLLPTRIASTAIIATTQDGYSPNFVTSISSPVINIVISLSEALNYTIDVTCTLFDSASSAGALTGFFSQGSIISPEINTTIQFTCTSTGKYRKFGCSYDSDLAVTVYTPKYFVQCTPPSIISVCPISTVFLPTTYTSTQYLPLRFSDTIVDSSVVVSCSSSIGAVNLPSSSFIVPVGKRHTKFPFQYGFSPLSATVACTGASVSGSQYVSSNTGSACYLKIASPLANIYPSQGYITSQSFLSVITTNFVASGVYLRCRSVLTTESSAATALADTTCPDSFTAPTSTIYWSITPDRIELTRSVHRLNVSRSLCPSSAEAGKVEVVVIICCNPDSTEIYSSLRQTAVFTVSLYNMQLNSTTFDTSTQASSSLPNPAFVDPAPCSCDLTDNFCDAGCCCDQQCLDYQPLTCISGSYGGRMTPPDKYSCAAKNQLDLPDFHPFLCDVFNNSATMGHFYGEVGAASTAAQLSANLAAVVVSNSLQSSSLDLGNRAYHQFDRAFDVALKRGDQLRLCSVQYDLGSADLEYDPPCQLSASPLQFPVASKLTPGFCQSLASIRYLEPFNDQGFDACPIVLSSTVCSAANALNLVPGQGATSSQTDGSRIHAQSYLLGSSATDRICPPFLRILKGRTTASGHVPIVINYFCLSNTELITRGYLASKSSPSVGPQEGFYSQTCTYNTTSLLTTCVPLASSTAAPPSPCSWDTGAVNPPAPSLDGNICSNTVVAVFYEFVWTAAAVSSLEVNMYLGDISVATPTTIYQVFSASFKSEDMFMDLNNDLLEHRSGILGYDPGLTLITATAANIGSDAFSVTLTSAEGTNSAVGVPVAGLHNSCEEGSISPPKFKMNAQANCYLYLPLSEFTDCQQLRSLVLGGMERYFDFNVVAQTGNPSLSNSSQWVVLQKPTTDFLATTAADAASRVVNQNECSRIPAGFNLNIFYAETGTVLGKSVEQVVGAQVTYDLVTWRFECASGEASSACKQAQPAAAGTALFNRFLLTTSVNFVRVPSDWPTAVRLTRDSGLSLPSVCKKQACWGDIFAPWWTFFNLNKKGEPAGIIAERRVALAFLFGTLGLVLLVLGWPIK